MNIEVIPVEDIFDVIELVFGKGQEEADNIQIESKAVNVLSASGA
ncbi:ATP-dependent protease La LonB type I [Acetivibrio straminisolvens JCM 21531]|uniref:ATP-dependent protease La LonB type I n=2 Tax=Acetivibrio straminisolvens TaxID=253314 RepID=W4V2L5_9FIRM|nr:ATP-dependent protease La LonB type I [Acetivibrio straminisolvens JCM 21531]